MLRMPYVRKSLLHATFYMHTRERRLESLLERARPTFEEAGEPRISLEDVRGGGLKAFEEVRAS